MTRKIGAIWNIVIASIIALFFAIVLSLSLLASDETYTSFIAYFLSIPFAVINFLILNPINMVLNQVLFAGTSNVDSLTNSINDFVTRALEGAGREGAAVVTIILPGANPALAESQISLQQFVNFIDGFYTLDNGYSQAQVSMANEVTRQFELYWTGKGVEMDNTFFYKYDDTMPNNFDTSIAFESLDQLRIIESSVESLASGQGIDGEIVIVSAVSPIDITLNDNSLYYVAVYLGPWTKFITSLIMLVILMVYVITIVTNIFSLSAWAKPGVTQFAGTLGFLFAGFIGGTLVLLDQGTVINLDALERALSQLHERDAKADAGKGLDAHAKFDEVATINELEKSRKLVKEKNIN